LTVNAQQLDNARPCVALADSNIAVLAQVEPAWQSVKNTAKTSSKHKFSGLAALPYRHWYWFLSPAHPFTPLRQPHQMLHQVVRNS
jgi:hypothetical protein